MPDYMVMILAKEADEARLSPAETRALLDGHAAYQQKLRADSVWLDGERLRPSSEGRRVRLREGRAQVESGPFSDDVLSGYYVLRAESLDAAVDLAAKCPLADGATLDVRPLLKGRHEPDKASRPGRVFASAVLGSAPNEAAWSELMDRIDERTSDHFPAGQMLGGVRLHAPGRGRRVAATGHQRAIFDGPFSETREVIGGVCFLRMPTLEAAVEWAIESAFVQHGTLEIRELWRS